MVGGGGDLFDFIVIIKKYFGLELDKKAWIYLGSHFAADNQSEPKFWPVFKFFTFHLD